MNRIIGNTVGTPYNLNKIVFEELNKYKQIVSIGSAYINELADGIYHVEGSDGSDDNEIYFGNGYGLQDGLLLVNHSDNNSCDWIAIGRDSGWDFGVFVGKTEVEDGEIVSSTYHKIENVGGSSVDIVTDFEGIDIGYDPSQVYNANVVNELFTQFTEAFATTEYVNELIGGIENGSY
jgi:hypothetical protein